MSLLRKKELKELPFTGIVLADWDDPDGRPMQGDGTVGGVEQGLAKRAMAGEFGACRMIGQSPPLLVPFNSEAHLTPWGPTAYPSRDPELSDYRKDEKGNYLGLTEAALAEGRRLTHGHYGFYDDLEVRGIIANEGLEYGLCSYDAVENYAEPTRALALAAEQAIDAREAYLNDCDEEDKAYDPKRLESLARAAERAKRNFCAQLGIDQEPWEREQ